MHKFQRIERLPPYILSVVTDLKMKARQRGEDIIDFGMGNPDQPTPQHIIEKLIEASQKPQNHRYSASRGIKRLRLAIADWYKRNYNVDLDYETEAIVTIGSKEGLSHLALAISGPGDTVLVPSPTYAIHTYAFIIAGADVVTVLLKKDNDFFEELTNTFKRLWPKPKAIVISFPHNPTTTCVELPFFEKVVAFAKEHDVIVIHDLAYADIVFDGYKAPSMMQVPGAKDVGVEFFTLSKSYNMPGWRVGFCVGNSEIIKALQKLKGYLDYGMFQPIQIASIIALNGPQDCVEEIRNTYKSRRDVLVDGLNRIGWKIEKPKATMFVWAEIPEQYKKIGSIEFAKLLLDKAKVAVSAGIGFGEGGDEYVRFALVENEQRTRQAIRGIKGIL
ncbi:MAG: alanine transaminase [Nitrospinae bacterium RIFCSPLOWO2_02_FULL_39_110]|nr:MAG: alanine transaminase [Nitrospinae bacterium RIFCSPLOWO2_02_FULL_39_110]OGW06155.1 MAG: alanine transaminase [Nitrospinae bacterium RIFCSPLOWO2_02_39_17]OGW07798.1 MAG: alanine transaminase [Nitrospinae bacterium RIFCSPLOWO2_12_FULL_39_93]OGW08861.1 MAG: alanine transaminase [Nitrospinae bacterium RIFCSPLOWO2_12_39_15]